MRYRHIFVAALLCASAFALHAAPGSTGAEEFYVRAHEMYATGNYTGAIDQASRYLQLAPAQLMSTGAERERAELLILRAALMHGDLQQAINKADAFVRNNAGSPLASNALWVKAEALFHAGKFAEAVNVYDSLPFDTFSRADKEAGLFHFAVSQAESGVYNKELFMNLLGTSFTDDALFYIAYIDYISNDLDNALNGFSAVSEYAAERLGTDFFIGQIFFKQGDYPKVLDNETAILAAARRLERNDNTHEAEAHRIIGEAAYHSGNLDKARESLGRHIESDANQGSESARYILGVMAYDNGDYTAADEWFSPIASNKSLLGQSASLYMGQSAARRGDYTAAAIYFDRAANMPYSSSVAETALYDYAASVAAGGRVPFGSASTLLEEFGNRYPDSKYAPVIDKYLALGYLAEKRYRKALDKLDKIKHPTEEVRTLTRRTLYELGTSELAAGRPSEAEYYLRRAAASSSNDSAAVSSRLWLAESLYAQKKYPEAITAYRQFLKDASSSDTNRASAYYNMAYALYQLGDYKSCRTALDNALKVKGTGALSQALRTDALLRCADCDNYLGNVREALTAYRQLAYDSDDAGSDYAALQAACLQGILGDNKAKRYALEQMLAKWPDSPWSQQAYYELAEACLNTSDFSEALKAQQRLQATAPESAMLRESKLNLAAAYLRANEPDKAIDTYKGVIKDWPSSSQADVASQALQNLYARKGQLNDFMQFLASVPGARTPEASEMDELSYVNATAALERDPLNGTGMEKYIAAFPNGRYMPDALLALANVSLALRMSDKALEYIDKILNNYSDNDATLSALILKGEILAAKDRKPEAAEAYLRLLSAGGAAYAPEAYKGLIFTAANPSEALAYIDKYLNLTTLNEEERSEALSLKADCMIAMGNNAEALSLLKSLAADTSTEQGGAAVVKMAQIYLKEGNPKEAEKLMLAFTANGCDDVDTLARGYIALADAYAAQGNKRRAYQYYESLGKNYPGNNPEIEKLIANGKKTNK
ncbi:MAG: tetratricopeptide repeat protein [Prevotella sp.]|nr:tetratricopeptide repeat protein [Prevotella sp.]MCM1075459.1 tetratricopeptide repeat protein [Ruminococcus sp.]